VAKTEDTAPDPGAPGTAPDTRLRASASAALAAACCLAAGAPVASAGRADLPDPCQIVPASLIASALGVKKAPAGTLVTVTNVSTCTYGSILSISVGYTALANPQHPASQSKVPGVPNGLYETYAGSTQTQITFVKGSAATGLYAVIRNFGRIPKKKLIKIAVAVSKGLGSTTGSAPGGTLVP
jgi:hypothetical protein